ncbi:unnamed protein product [Boreogadus saida]
MDSKTTRICKTCNTGYILPYDGHEVCEGCLGHEHAVLALSQLCLCRHCAALPSDDRQRRADTTAAIAEWADDFTVPLDDGPSLLVSSESDDSDRDGASPPASPLRMGRPGAAALPVSAATSLPVVGALVGIIARAAANHGLAVPMPQAHQRPDQLHGIWGLEAATRPARLDPIWPMFPAIRLYLSGAAAEPGKLGAPPGLSDRCPTSKDQLTAKLTDIAHQCKMQQEAVMNNITLLAPNISTMAADPHRLAEQAVDVAKTAGVILCLCSTGAVAAARTATWQHLIQRNLWLQQTPGIPEPMRRRLLECPIRPAGCSGPVCHLGWMTCRLLPRRQRNSGDTSPALRLHPGSGAPLQAPVAAIGHCHDAAGSSSSWPPGLPAPPASITGCGERPAKAPGSGLMGLCPTPKAPAKAITGGVTALSVMRLLGMMSASHTVVPAGAASHEAAAEMVFSPAHRPDTDGKRAGL